MFARSLLFFGLLSVSLQVFSNSFTQYPTSTDTDGAYTLSWTEPTANGYDRWWVREIKNGSFLNQLGTNQTTVAISGRGEGSYSYELWSEKTYYDSSIGEYLIQKRKLDTVSVNVSLALDPPLAPIAPSLSNSGSYLVSWGSVDGAIRYTLEEKRNSGGWSVVQNNSSRSIQFSGKSAATYYYRVLACTASMCSPWSATTVTRVVFAPSSVPTITSGNVQTTFTRAADINISWSSVSTATNYKLHELVNAAWVQRSASSALSTLIRNRALGNYDFRLQACNAGGCSNWSSTFRVTVSQVTNLSGPSTARGAFTLTLLTPGGYYTNLRQNNQTIYSRYSGLSFSISAVDGTHSYTAQSCQYDTEDNFVCQPYGVAKSVTVLNVPGVPAALTAPSTLIEAGSMVVNWELASGVVHEYDFDYRRDSGGWVNGYNGTARSASVSLNSGLYSFRVRACNTLAGDRRCSGWRAGQTHNLARVSQPSISPNGGTHIGSASVSLSVPSGASVRYTTDGSNVSSSSNAYSGPFSITRNTTVKAKAFKSGMAESLQASANLAIKVPAPAISPAGGTYTSSRAVSFSVPSGATVRYTTNGTNVTSTSTAYTGAFTLRANATVKARAYKSGLVASDQTQSAFNIRVAQPSISPSSGTFIEKGDVTINVPTGAQVRYTTNGANVTSSSALYSAPIRLTSSASVKAKAFKSGMTESTQASASFTVLQRAATPSISPNGGTYAESARVTLGVPSGAIVRYTTNGAAVTSSSPIYSTPFTLNTNSTVKVKAFKSGMAESLQGEAVFTIITAGALSDIPDADYTATSDPAQDLVGELSGSAQVSGGAFSYSIPLSVAPGINGMEPTVSLNYSSQKGMGNAGFGWNLSAGSSISRCASIYPLDGMRQNVMRSDRDKLCLDGQRLVLISGTHGEPGAVYQPERSMDATVFLKGGSFSTTSSYFEVRSKNGRLRTYDESFVPLGVTGSVSENVPLSWQISEDEDTFGNNIRYVYTSGSGFMLLRDIYYTGHDGTQGNRQLEFVYESKVDDSNIEVYHLNGYGYKTIVSHRLSRINLKIAGTQADYYDLVHNANQTVSSFKHCFDSACLQSDFGYKQVSGNAFTATDNHINAADSDSDDYYMLVAPYEKVGDFDGDGIDELGFYHDDGNGYRVLRFYFSASGEVKPARNITQIADAQGLSIEYDCDTATSIACLSEYSVFSNAFQGDMDFDYDGRKDIVYINNGGNVAIANWQNDTPIDTGIDGNCQVPGPAVYYGVITCQSFVLDMNQDGRKDLLVSVGSPSDSGGVYKAYLRNADDNGFAYAGEGSGYLNGYQLVDVNGDGLVDLIHPGRMHWLRVNLIGGVVSFSGQDLPFKNDVDRGSASRSEHTKIADLNGDGLADILTLSLKPANVNSYDLGWYVAINEGRGRFSGLVYTGKSEQISSNDIGESQSGSNSLSEYMKTFDYNGDGRTDFLLPNQSRIAYNCVNYPVNANNCYDEHETLQHWRSDVWSWKVWQSRADGKGFDEIVLDSSILGALNTTTLVDYNGDGQLDIASNIGYDGWLTWSFPSSHADKIGTHVYLRHANQFQHKLLETVTTDFGEKLHVTYASLNSTSVDGEALYTVDPAPQEFPYVNFGSSMVVVDQLQTNNGVGGKNTSRYKYADARYHYQGRGFQGFREIIVQNVEGDTTRRTEFYQEFPLSGQIKTQRTLQTSSGRLLQYSAAVAGTEVTTNNCAYIGTRNGESYDLVSGGLVSATTIVVDFDDNCNPTTRDTTTVDYSLPGDTGAWITHTASATTQMVAVGGMQGAFRKTSESVLQNVIYGADDRSVTLPNSDTEKNLSTTYSYASSGDIAPQSITVTGGDTLTTTFAYDDFGHVTRTSHTGTNLSESKPRWEQTSYTDDGYFISSTQNSEWGEAVNAVSFSEYLPRYGLPKSVTDVNGVVTSTRYNRLGLIIKTHACKDNICPAPPVYTQYQWCNGSCAAGAYKVTNEQVGSQTVITFFDVLGRDIRKEVSSFGERDNTVATKTYNGLGHMIAEVNPGGGTVTYSDFDVLGRPERKIVNHDPLHYTSYYTYQGLRTNIRVVGDRTLSMSRTTNSRGQLMRTKDANENFGYFAYDGAGNPVLVQDVNGQNIIASYNGLGFKTQVSDPNQGLITFTYNGMGELLTQKDANNLLTVLERDDLGRVHTKTQGSDISRWYFDGEQYGLLDGSERSGHSVSVDYDTFGRPLIRRTTIDGSVYQHSFAYDSTYGRLKGQQSPNNKVLAFAYDTQGFRTHDYQPDSAGGVLRSYAAFADYESTGQLKTLRFGNGLVQAFTYNLPSGQMDAVCTDTSLGCGSAWSAQAVDYTYDGFGNLVVMADAVGNLYRDFYYDDLHRLDYAETRLNGNAVQTTNYDYDAAGNLLLKDDYASDYRYGNASRSAGGNAGPNAVRQLNKNGVTVSFAYDNAGNMTAGDGLSITYDGNHHTKTVSRNGAHLTFYYDADGQRYKQVKVKGGVTTTTIYVGDYEHVTEVGASSKVEARLYIGSHTILTQAISGANDDPAISHIARDRLGSVSLVMDGDRHIDDGHNAQDLVLERRAYDAFGKAIVLPTGLLPSLFATTDRGFTDHEHLLDVELIHMNGRAFDYNLGRFLSVDPFIQGVANTQSVNPYSYILNNPMSGIDPTGYSRIDRSRDLGSFIATNIDEDYASTILNADDELRATISVGGKSTSITVTVVNSDGDITHSSSFSAAGTFKTTGKGATLGYSGGAQQGNTEAEFASVGVDLGQSAPEYNDPVVSGDKAKVGEVAGGPLLLGVPIYYWIVGGGAVVASQTDAGKEATEALVVGMREAVSGNVASPGGFDPENQNNRRRSNKTDGPKFGNLKDHAHRHGLKGQSTNSYYNSAVQHTRTGTKFAFRHNLSQKTAYITRTGPNNFTFTSTSRGGGRIYTHMYGHQVNARYLSNLGIKLPKGF